MTPRIIPDRDRERNWYLDEDFEITLFDGTRLIIETPYRFDGHSTGIFSPLFKENSGSDIIAALVHDYLIDTMPWHRFTRYYIDQAYQYTHELYSHDRFRTYWMPKGVYVWGFLKSWGYTDYRGEVKEGTVIHVRVTHDVMV